MTFPHTFIFQKIAELGRWLAENIASLQKEQIQSNTNSGRDYITYFHVTVIKGKKLLGPTMLCYKENHNHQISKWRLTD